MARTPPGRPFLGGALTAFGPARSREVVRRRLVLAACSVGLFLAFLQITQTISALGALQRDLDLSGVQVVWVPSSYTLAVATLVLSGGAVGDRWGRRSTFQVGIVLMAAGAALITAADSLVAVVAGQAVAGVGAAAVLPNSLSILTATFPDPAARARAIAVWIGASGLGLAVGPLLAGAVQLWFGWHAVFLATLPVAAVALALTSVVPQSRAAAHRLDWAGQVLAVVGLGALVFGLIEGGQQGYLSGVVVGAVAVAVLGVVGFVVVELRTPEPMFDVRLLRRPGYSAALLVAAVGLFAFVGVTLLQVLFLQRVQGLTPWDSAVRLSAEMGTFVVVTLLAGRVVPWMGPRWLLVGGLALSGVGCLALSLQQPATSYAHSGSALVLLGAGCGLVVAPSTVAAVAAVPTALAAKAAAAVNAARQLGAVLGTTALGATATTTFLAELPSELDRRGVPGEQAAAVVEAVHTGSRADGARSSPVTGPVFEPVSEPISEAVGAAFTAGVHAGVLTAGVVLLAAAGVAGFTIRDWTAPPPATHPTVPARPRSTGTPAPAATPVGTASNTASSNTTSPKETDR